MGFGVRGGFQYSYKAGNYMEKDKYQQYLFGVIPIDTISPVSIFNGGMITMSTYSFLLDFYTMCMKMRSFSSVIL